MFSRAPEWMVGICEWPGVVCWIFEKVLFFFLLINMYVFNSVFHLSFVIKKTKTISRRNMWTTTAPAFLTAPLQGIFFLSLPWTALADIEPQGCMEAPIWHLLLDFERQHLIGYYCLKSAGTHYMLPNKQEKGQMSYFHFQEWITEIKHTGEWKK